MPEQFISPLPQNQTIGQNQGAVSLLIEDYIFPDKFIGKMKRSLMGNCEFRYSQERGEMVLGEWVKVLSESRDEDKWVWMSPPVNMPLVKNPKLWQAIEHYIRTILNSATALSKMKDCQINSKQKIWAFGKYLLRNWKDFELDHATYDEIFVTLAYFTFSSYTAARDGDIKRWTTSIISVSESKAVVEEKKKATGLEGVFRE